MKLHKRVLAGLMAALLLLAVGPAESQTVTLVGFTPATALTGSEFLWGEQPGNNTGPTGPTVRISIPQILAYVLANGGGGGGGGVSTFNSRAGAVTLNSGDVTTALGFTPLSNTTPGLAFLANANTFTNSNTFSGQVILSRRTVSASTTLANATDNVVCGDVSGGAITLTMPANPIPNGRSISINDCKRQAGTHTLTVAGNTGQTISGAASVAITINGSSINAVWNSTDNDWNLF